MLQVDFKKLLSQINELSVNQFRQLETTLNKRHKTTEAIEILESNVLADRNCPRCDGGHLIGWGKERGLQRFKCKVCKRTCTSLTNTNLSKLHYKDKWMDFADCLSKGTSLEQSANLLGIHRNTAFRWRHRFLDRMKEQSDTTLAGIAEADETYVLESQKGAKSGLEREPRARGGKAKQRGLSKEQIPILVCRDRNGNTVDFVLKDDRSSGAIRSLLESHVAKDTVVCTDASKTLAKALSQLSVVHKQINLAKNIRVLEGIYHVQNVNAYDSRMKSWGIRFHGVATKYLPNYLGWYRLLDRLGKAPPARDIFVAALGLNRYPRVSVI